MEPRARSGRVLIQWHKGWPKPTCCAWLIAPPAAAATSNSEASPEDLGQGLARAAERVIGWRESFAAAGMIRKARAIPCARRRGRVLGADSGVVPAGLVVPFRFWPKKRPQWLFLPVLKVTAGHFL